MNYHLYIIILSIVFKYFLLRNSMFCNNHKSQLSHSSTSRFQGDSKILWMSPLNSVKILFYNTSMRQKGSTSLTLTSMENEL